MFRNNVRLRRAHDQLPACPDHARGHKRCAHPRCLTISSGKTAKNAKNYEVIQQGD